MPSWLIHSCLTVAGFGLLGAGIYIFEESGWKRLLIRRRAKKLRNRLEPLASALDITVSMQDVEQDLVIFYTFNDGNFVSLSVSESGFNCFTPAWNPGHDKNTEGLSLLMKAIKAEHQKLMSDDGG